jgi:HB1/ASXL restriction endonuclease-like protein with HTH domain
MADLSWRDAILKVLEESREPMHYTDIAEAVATQGLRSEVGATPAATVNAIISMSIQNDEDHSPFFRVSRGLYSLRPAGLTATILRPDPAGEESDDTGLINAFGMYWARSAVQWTASPKVLGQQQPGSTPVDFFGQRGVYLLHDGRAVVYVGRTTEQSLGTRLRQHTLDRLNGRWNRFSWFGVFPVGESGALKADGVGTYNLEMLITTMEALLIEGLEPPQNRKRGDEFQAVEFLQVEDPEIERTQTIQLMEKLKRKL